MVALKNKKNNLKKKDIIKNIFDQTGISSLYSKKNFKRYNRNINQQFNIRKNN